MKFSRVLIMALVMLIAVISAVTAAEKKTDNDFVANTIEVNGSSGEISSKEITVKPGDYIKVNLYAAGGTGYGWQLDSDSAALLEEVSKNTVPVGDKHLVGGPVRWEFLLLVKPEAAESITLHFVLVRPWEKNEKPAQVFALHVLLEEPEKAAQTVKIIKREYQEGSSKVFFPQLSGIGDTKLAANINEKLKNAILSIGNQSANSSIHGDFTVSFYNGFLLGIHFTGTSFAPGAAHPNKIDCGIHIDLSTGEIYNLEDLFLKDADFTTRIKELCLANEKDYRVKADGFWDGWAYQNFVNSWTGQDQSFLLSAHSMRVYSIPAYVTGAISGYQVPYADLMDMINTDGALWKRLTSKESRTIEVLAE